MPLVQPAFSDQCDVRAASARVTQLDAGTGVGAGLVGQP